MFRRKPSILLVFLSILLAGCQQVAPPFECTDALGFALVNSLKPLSAPDAQPRQEQLLFHRIGGPVPTVHRQG